MDHKMLKETNRLVNKLIDKLRIRRQPKKNKLEIIEPYLIKIIFFN